MTPWSIEPESCGLVAATKCATASHVWWYSLKITKALLTLDLYKCMGARFVAVQSEHFTVCTAVPRTAHYGMCRHGTPVQSRCSTLSSVAGFTQNHLTDFHKICASSVGIATLYGLEGPGIESWWGGEIFRTRPDRPWGPPSLLYSGYRVFPRGKAAGAWRWPPTPSSSEFKERVELRVYFYSPCGP